MPSIGNEVLNLVKDTSLIYVLGASELLKAGRSAVNTYATALPFVVVGILYLAMCGGFSWLSGRIRETHQLLLGGQVMSCIAENCAKRTTFGRTPVF